MINKDTAVGNVSPHSHDNSQNKNAMNPIGNITGNANQNSKLAEVGEKFFQGDQFANQYASRPPVDPAMPIPPQPDPINNQYGNMFMQPFSQKKIVKDPVPQPPRIETEQIPEVAIKPPPQKIYKEMTQQLVKKLPKEKTGKLVEQRIQVPEQKIEKPREMPKKVIPPTNMNGDPVKSDTLYLPNKYKKQAGKMIDETDYDDLSKKVKNYNRKLVEDLQDMGKIKLNEKGKPYVVNRKN